MLILDYIHKYAVIIPVCCQFKNLFCIFYRKDVHKKAFICIVVVIMVLQILVITPCINRVKNFVMFNSEKANTWFRIYMIRHFENSYFLYICQNLCWNITIGSYNLKSIIGFSQITIFCHTKAAKIKGLHKSFHYNFFTNWWQANST